MTVDDIPDRGENTFLSFFRRSFLIEQLQLNPWIALGHFIQEYLRNDLNIRRRQQEAHLVFTALSGQEDVGNAVPSQFFSFLRQTTKTTVQTNPCEQCASYQGRTSI